MTWPLILEKLRSFISLVHTVWLVLSSGIRAKLAWFTGSLIACTIIALSFLTVRQQTEILTESYEKQAAISRNFIAGMVLEIENVSQNLIRIEEFRNRIAKQREELKKYRTHKTTDEVKSVSFFGFKTKLFGALGTEKITKQVDSFYSTYLTNSEVLIIERKTREQLNSAGKRPLSDGEWRSLQGLARKFVQSESLAIMIGNQIQLKKEKLKANELAKLEADIKNAGNTARKSRSEIDQIVARIFAGSKKRKLEELGLDSNLFRIQTFPLNSNSIGKVVEASFDTRILDQNTKLASFNQFSDLSQGLNMAISEFTNSIVSAREGKTVEIEWKDREIQALHAPLFRNPSSTKRAQNLYTNKDALGDYSQVVKDDLEATKRISEIIPKLRNRIARLKQSRPPIPPFRDAEFRKLYTFYNDAVDNRNQSFDVLMLEKPLSPESMENIEPLRSLRDSAFEDWIFLKFKTDNSDYDHYFQNDEDLLLHRTRWKTLRLWISEAKSETPTPALRKLFPDGTLAHSRSESEEILWKLDSIPIFGDKNVSVSREVLETNFSGLIRTLVDRTDGIHAINSNKNQVVITALGICLVAILLAIFISGVVVQKIRKIIRSAEKVGEGDLEVVFIDGGNDEFGNLTVSLNHMVSGLRDREKMRGVLGSMVDPVVVGEAMKDLESLKRGSEKVITAFFSDIAGFSNISEKLKPYELASLLNEYLSAMTVILKNHDGVLDKYIGDAIVGIFNAPLDVEDHCKKAVIASLEMQAKLAELKVGWKKQGKYIPEAHEMRFRIGLNTGSAKVGFMGTDALASYTMMGDTVNLAARLEAAGKDYGVWILATDTVYNIVKEIVFTRKLDYVRVKGKSTPVILYEIICLAGEETAAQKKFVKLYEEALFSYVNRFWKDAIDKFQESEKTKGDIDIACSVLLERCRDYQEAPPPSDWDGVFTRTHK